jgi:hypothetical protein
MLTLHRNATLTLAEKFTAQTLVPSHHHQHPRLLLKQPLRLLAPALNATLTPMELFTVLKR